NYSDGSYQLVQTLDLGRDPEFSPQTGDSNNDGIIDLPIGSNVGFSKYLRILQFDGVDYEFVEDGPNNGDTWVQPTVGDVDGDGYDEIVYGHEIADPDPNALDVYQVTSGNFDLETTIGPETGYEYFWRPRIGDITGDGVDDLVFTGETSTSVDTFAYAVNSTSPNQRPTSPHFIDMPNSTAGNSLLTEWNESTDLDGIVHRYELEIDNSSSFLAPQIFETTETSYRVSMLENGTYYFRVRAVDDEGLASIWSGTHVTVVEIPAEAVPPALTISYIEDIYTTPSATIAWSEPDLSAGGSVDYEAELAKNSNFTLNREKHYCSKPNITVRYLAEGTYYFRVRARVNGSIYGPWSDTESFFVYLSTITIVGPEDFFILDTATNASVSWTVNSEYRFSYSIYIDSLRMNSDENRLTNITFLLPKLAIGQHNITLEIIDLAGSTFVDSVQVTVVQNIGALTISLSFHGGLILIVAAISMYLYRSKKREKWEEFFP
ncbi:MAG: VCBS repeat-containing protein, partial [Candidatus Thorarchaeota archaeon]|nr:VCBS repeat-containing protein [Candidatus Thorarchaeota archaeon]